MKTNCLTRPRPRSRPRSRFEAVYDTSAAKAAAGAPSPWGEGECPNVSRLVQLSILALALCFAFSSPAQTFSFPGLNLVIPDGQASGVASFETISTAIHQIGSIQVSLTITGNFNGDLYCYLQHGTGLSVLLNRPGRTAANVDGYDDSGFAITLDDNAPHGDIHNYQGVITPPLGTPLTGLWQPDGRKIDPASVLDTDPRTAMLSSFNGLDPNGDWTLFVADLSAGGVSVLNNWQLVINPVPEPSTAALLGAGGLILLGRARRRSYSFSSPESLR
jgi:subtilisin-like proprotein convertase family protein